MKNEELNKLEESAEMKHLLKASKALYEKDKAENPPRSFDSLIKKIEQQERPSHRMGISPWWLAAACLVGVLIGWNFPFGNSSKDDRLAVNDTVVVTEKQTDTVYRQAPVLQKAVERKQRKSVVHQQIVQPQTISFPVMCTEVALPSLKNPRPANAGRSLTQEDFPIHLLVSL